MWDTLPEFWEEYGRREKRGEDAQHSHGAELQISSSWGTQPGDHGVRAMDCDFLINI